MKKLITIALSSLALVAFAAVSQADDKDCMLEGTVYKSGEGADNTKVQFHSMGRYDENSKCRVRKDEKVEFKLPADPRLEDAPDGSKVRYRYQENSEGQSSTKLISVGA